MLFDEWDEEDKEEDTNLETPEQATDLFAQTRDMSPSIVAEENLYESRASEILYGHQDIEQKLLHMITLNRLPHGIIFSGPAGVGKSVMAYRLARFLLAGLGEKDHGDTPDMFGGLVHTPFPSTLILGRDHAVFAQVASGGHPDLLTITRSVDVTTGAIKTSLSVEEIRKIAPFLRRTAANEGGWRIVIVDDADTMTRASQNSLLKILEEPPQKSLIILITHRAGAILPTIYSRSTYMAFQPLPSHIIAEALRNRANKEIVPMVLAIADGSLGRALKFVHTDNEDIVQMLFAILNSQFRWSQIFHMADLYGAKSNAEQLLIFQEIMLFVAQSLVRRAAGVEQLSMSQPTAIAEENSSTYYELGSMALGRALTLSTALLLYDELAQHFLLCSTGNLDKKFIILGAFTILDKHLPRE